MRKYEVLNYLLFGVATTFVNIITYFFFLDRLHLHYLWANSFSWVFSVLFAFVTNKKWVFHSPTNTKKAWMKEAFFFFYYRGVSYGLDMIMMFALVHVMHTTNLTAKLITQIIVVVANYLFSKYLIFNRK